MRPVKGLVGSDAPQPTMVLKRLLGKWASLSIAFMLATLVAIVAIPGSACLLAFATPSDQESTNSQEASVNAGDATGVESGAAATEANVEGGSSEGSSGNASSLDTQDNYIDTSQLPDNSFIYDTSIADLAQADTYYDSLTLQVSGEAIGDIIHAEGDPDHCWVTLYSDNATVQIYMTNTAAERIDTLGCYGKQGTTLRVRGTFNLVCADHEGASDLHADSVTVTEMGKSVQIDPRLPYLAGGMILVLVGGLMMLVLHYLRERDR